MTTLDDLAARREAFRHFRTRVEEDLRRERAERLANEVAVINQLVYQAAAEGATIGEIMRSYGTKDRRTIADLVRNHSAEIEALKKAHARKESESGAPEWLTIYDPTGFFVDLGEHHASYAATTMGDGTLLFTTGNPLWNEDFTIKNEAVALLDGKTETDSDEASIVARYLRKYAG